VVLPKEYDDSDAQCTAFVRALGDAGLLRYCVPVSAGGAGQHSKGALDTRALGVIRESLAWGSGLADLAFVMQALGGGPISVAGTAQQQQRYLAPAGRGDKVMAFALTEPDAGTDVAAIACTAVQDGGAWVLQGRKKFISQATIADVFCVFARTADTGSKGITAFLVEKGQRGLSVHAQKPMAPHPLGEVVLDGVRVEDAQRVGAPGEGMKVALRTLDMCRPTVAAASCGMARRALDEAVARSKARVQFGKPISEHQLIQQKLARMSVDVAASVLLTARACSEVDSGAQATLAVSQAKLFATEAAQRVIDDAVQIFGGDGVMVGCAVERLYREIRALRIYEGTSEVQHLVIARQLLR